MGIGSRGHSSLAQAMCGRPHSVQRYCEHWQQFENTHILQYGSHRVPLTPKEYSPSSSSTKSVAVECLANIYVGGCTVFEVLLLEHNRLSSLFQIRLFQAKFMLQKWLLDPDLQAQFDLGPGWRASLLGGGHRYILGSVC